MSLSRKSGSSLSSWGTQAKLNKALGLLKKQEIPQEESVEVEFKFEVKSVDPNAKASVSPEQLDELIKAQSLSRSTQSSHSVQMQAKRKAEEKQLDVTSDNMQAIGLGGPSSPIAIPKY